MPQLRRLFGKNDEDGLGYFLRQMRIAHLPAGGGMDQPDMAFDQSGECGLGIIGRIFGEQFGVALHLNY